ncbi:MAG: hypothetical protein A3G81_13365 [Betaproteobacteria bacterium RIFCSPLOWO2_12_FULL_65_14]|nr:MAG: hypothetical protein A3G81_13365 [Betaproteobacteria bacterium RIFCSPLOWO2_12_FULL_65_14]
MSGTIIALAGVALSAALWFPGSAAAQKAGALSPEEDKFLSLLQENVASGGPPKDGIPAIDKPQYTSAAEADQWLSPEDVVFGVNHAGLVAAYPQRILVWHEIANETLGGEKLSITYCPLTGTAIGYKGSVAPQTSSSFGVSGKLVSSNLVMYDRSTDSRWPQILGRAIDGRARGGRLEEFPVVWTTWESWKKKHPQTKVLSRRTGFVRNYGRTGDPYGNYLGKDKGYYGSEQLLFRPIFEDKRLHPKAVVVGVRDGAGNAVAVLKDRLRREKRIEARLGDRTVVLTYDPALDSHSAAVKATGEWINAFDAMWFAWKGFYPDTQLLR